MRYAAGLIVLALAGWLAFALVKPPTPAAQAGAFVTSKDCRACHEEVYAEWEQSWHARSWTDPDVRAPGQSNNFQNTDCIDCHAPRDIFETGIGNRVLPRTERRAEGVDCIACHRLPGGGMAGTITDERAACRPVVTRELQRVEFCAGCHNQHKTVDQWRETSFAERGEDCLFCHMPYRDGDPNRGRSHVMLGGHDIELVRSAVSLRARREGETVLVELENHGAAHAYPTDERSRASDVWWRPTTDAGDAGDAGDAQPWRHLHRIRDPYRWEVDVPSTLLHSGEVREVLLDDPEAMGPVEVLLVYKLTPFYRDPATGEPKHLEEVSDPLTDSIEVQRVSVP